MPVAARVKSFSIRPGDIFDEKFKRVADDLAVPHSIRVVGDEDHLLVEVLRRRLAHHTHLKLRR